VYLVISMVLVNAFLAVALRPKAPTLEEILRGMHGDIRKERGFEQDCAYMVDGSVMYRFVTSIDGEKIHTRVWSGGALVVEGGHNENRRFTINYSDKTYWDFAEKNKDFSLAYKPAVVTPSAVDNQFYLGVQDSYDISIIAEPNPVVLSVEDATYDNAPARLVVVEFGQPSKRAQMRLYFERGRWILLRAEAYNLGEKKQSMSLTCKITRGKTFPSSDFILEPSSVTGFTKKDPEGGRRQIISG